jgi:hypothetical protein
MDLSFINVPTSQAELLGLLHVAYKAGQESIETKIIAHPVEGQPALHAKKSAKYSFKGWLSRLAHQWEDIKHS